MKGFDAAIRVDHATGSAGFLDSYDALATTGRPPEEIAALQTGLLLQWVFEQPAKLFAELRASRPIFITPVVVVAALYQDVMEIADLDDVFSVKPYGDSMERHNDGPNFLIGMDDSEEFDRDRALLRLAIRRSDLVDVRASVAARAGEALDQSEGRVELCDAYARTISSQVLSQYYFGKHGPGPELLMPWCRKQYRDIFVNFAGDTEVREAGMQAGAEFRACVDELIAAQHEHGAEDGADTVLARLVAQQCVVDASFPDYRIRDNLVGCTVGVIDNVGCAVANAFDILLDHPDELAAAAAAAQAGEDELVLGYMLEALRFHPAASVLVRRCTRDETLAKGTDRETLIPADSLVFASNGSAMMDEVELPNPLEFDPRRPRHHHLHYGWGMHHCLGSHLANAQLTEFAKALLARENLRRAPGDEGQLTYTGAFPNPFVLEFDPVRIGV